MTKSEEDWQKQLTPDQYRVLRNKETEAPFSGAYLDNKTPGVYTCAGCSAVLFESSTKFDSGSGWPSFYDIAEEGKVRLIEDNAHGLQRVEVVCANCDGHLGHLFDDAFDQPTGKRYCINSCSLDFKPAKKS